MKTTFPSTLFVFAAFPTLIVTAAPEKDGPVPSLTPEQAGAEAKNPRKEGKSGDPAAPGRDSKSPQLKEEEFVRHGIQGAQFYIRLATLARSRAQAGEVKAFAETMIKDYTTSLELLQATALRANISIREEPNAKDRPL